MVVDIETTGLSRYRHSITEISAIKVKKGKVIDEFNTLVNPECHIPSFITRLTGIDDDLVKDAQKIKKVIPKFETFVSGAVFVAHNAMFDFNFLNHAVSENLGKTLENDILCTCRLARRLLPELPSKRLGCVCEHFEITNEKAHRARGDAVATTQIFNKFVGMMKKKDVKDVESALQFQKSKIPK